jgi:hypothetical protein
MCCIVVSSTSSAPPCGTCPYSFCLSCIAAVRRAQAEVGAAKDGCPVCTVVAANPNHARLFRLSSRSRLSLPYLTSFPVQASAKKSICDRCLRCRITGAVHCTSCPLTFHPTCLNSDFGFSSGFVCSECCAQKSPPPPSELTDEVLRHLRLCRGPRG